MKWFWPVSIGSVLCLCGGLSVLGMPAALGLPATSQPDVAGAPSDAPDSKQAAPTRAGTGAGEVEQASPPPQIQEPRETWPVLPDLTQTDPALGVAGGGNSHCGPVAVSNGLVWLSQHGYPELLPAAAEAPGAVDASAGNDLPERIHERQLELVREISAAPFMGTSRWSGTGPVGVLRGLHRFVKRHGYRYQRLEYQGWRGHQKAFSTGVRKPQLPWIAEALKQGGVAFIHVGWYTPVPRSKVLQRTGGHWLTVIAAGVDEHFLADPNVLVLHDPAPYAGDEPARSFATARELKEGWLLARGSRQAFSAKGYYSLEGGMHIKKAGDLAVLDGVVVLVMDPATANGTAKAEAKRAKLGPQGRALTASLP
ncbi:MAG: hypothetical protein H6718_07275 [Polyangiaceae bacterium]|nr:hypothetical protein [Polyangiaceae bacterium]